ncbi:MAG: beta-lactamase family protein [Alphaproteobacteria bacterium]|nr:beta-lactamase family protein [Alphaproteobacteria bacterium]
MNERAPVSGTCAPQFQGVRDVLAGLLDDGREIGCAVCVYADGQKVVDLWGGLADPSTTRKWEKDTIVSTFSVSKALVSTMGHMLVDRGMVDLDQPVAKYWPEFGHTGKDGILVRHLLDHRCAISYVDRRLAAGDLYNWDLMIEAIEETRPNWEPGVKPVYLNMTYGYLMGGLVYRLTGKRIGQFNREELCGPLGLDYNFALTADEKGRCATVLQKNSPRALFDEVENNPDTLFARTMQGFGPDEDFNSDGWRSNEVGSGQGHGNARAIAGLFEMLRAGGELNGVKIMSPQTRDRAVEFQCESEGDDPVLGKPVRFALGYEINNPTFPMGPNPKTFGHWGAGGAFGFGDVSNGISFGYTPNYMHDSLELGPRGAALVDAVFASL